MSAEQTPIPPIPPTPQCPAWPTPPGQAPHDTLVDFFHAAVGGGWPLGGAGETLREAFRSQRRGAFGGQAGSERHRGQSLQAEGGHERETCTLPTPLPPCSRGAGGVPGGDIAPHAECAALGLRQLQLVANPTAVQREAACPGPLEAAPPAQQESQAAV